MLFYLRDYVIEVGDAIPKEINNSIDAKLICVNDTENSGVHEDSDNISLVEPAGALVIIWKSEEFEH